jgi:hypothetical protein
MEAGQSWPGESLDAPSDGAKFLGDKVHAGVLQENAGDTWMLAG